MSSLLAGTARADTARETADRVVEPRSLDSSTGGYVREGSHRGVPPPPANDVCDSATLIPMCGIYTDSGNSLFANDDYSPAAVSCCEGCTGRYAIGPDVVYRMDLWGEEQLTIEYTQTAADASVYVITDCSDPIGSCIAGADNTSFGETETLFLEAFGSGSRTYYLICDVYAGDGSDYTLDVWVNCPIPAETASWGGVKARFGAR